MASDKESRICVRLFAENGEELGNPVVLPTSTTSEELESLANQFLEKEDDPIPIGQILYQSFRYIKYLFSFQLFELLKALILLKLLLHR